MGDAVSSPRIMLLVSQFNARITEALVEGAMGVLHRNGVSATDWCRVDVPGAFELPLAAKRAAATGKWDAVICLGCVIRGGTPHFDYVCAEAARGIMQASLDTGVPVIFGVLTTDTEEQAFARCGISAAPTAAGSKPVVENKGVDAVEAAFEILTALRQISSE